MRNYLLNLCFFISQIMCIKQSQDTHILYVVTKSGLKMFNKIHIITKKHQTIIIIFWLQNHLQLLKFQYYKPH